MALLVNLRHLEQDDVLLKGELPSAELDLANIDELIHITEPLKHDLEAEKLEQAILVQGNISLVIECECVRCLKPFKYKLEINGWACHLPLEGEDSVTVSNDSVDLTPFLREDILLEFPQHPLCKPECSGLPKKAVKKSTGAADLTKENASAWAELNKLKL